MANFPMAIFPFNPFQIPGYYGIPPQDYVYEYNGSSFTLTKDNKIVIKGNLKDAAFGLLKHIIVFSEIRMRPMSIDGLEFVYNEDAISLKWNGTEPLPDNFEEFVQQFEKLSKLMVFS